ncbi:hypothetical protein BKA69DRAFT_1037301 [Paraphysoderma sedebokerense]|nr:hypothetical protein BKA69DRAFT_1037301 [Paraphysoderma sedebokerense]
MPAFTKHGGIESWFKSLHGIINSLDNIKFYGVYIWDIRYEGSIDYLRKHNIYAFTSVNDMEQACHITLSTAFHYLDNPYMYQVQVIHGSGFDNWTWRYARFAKLYNHVVAVSYNSLERQNKNVLKKSSYIPSFVKKHENCDPDASRYKFCDRQILFLGRLSSEKRPELFCKALCELPHCGVLIGPYYFDVNRPSCECPNVHIIGDRNDGQCFMRHSEFLFVPSDTEGGPIVAIEAWLNDLPVVMKETGLAVNYPSSFLIYDWDKMDLNELRTLLTNKTQIQEAKDAAQMTYMKEFSEPVLKAAWKKIIDDGIKYLQWKGVQLNWELYKSEQAFITQQGRSVNINCVEVKCTVGFKVRALSTKILIKYNVATLTGTIILNAKSEGRSQSFRISSAGKGQVASTLDTKVGSEVLVDIMSDQAYIILQDIIFPS